MTVIHLIRGGGDLATGVALRLHRAGLRILITELPQPLVVRRLVSFAEAVYRGQFAVEGVNARRAKDLAEAFEVMDQGDIPILVDPDAQVLHELQINHHAFHTHSSTNPTSRFKVLIDARMTKRPPELGMQAASLLIGLGPGFVAGENCHAVIETKRGHFLGRVVWHGAAEPDTGQPEGVVERRVERVLRAPQDGIFKPVASIGDQVKPGQVIAYVDSSSIAAPFQGVVRGLLYPGLFVNAGLKIGDLDPRDDPRYCTLVSDKSLAVGGGVLEAILSRPELRADLWGEISRE